MKRWKATAGTAVIALGLMILAGCATAPVPQDNTEQYADLDRIISPNTLPVYRDAKMLQVSSYDTTGGNDDRINIHPGKTATIA